MKLRNTVYCRIFLPSFNLAFSPLRLIYAGFLKILRRTQRVVNVLRFTPLNTPQFVFFVNRSDRVHKTTADFGEDRE